MMTDLEARVAATTALLREAAGAAGMVVTADDRISESDAEVLTGYGKGSFRGLRDLGLAPPFYRAAANGSRISYRLRDLSEWLENRREEPRL